MALPAQIKRQIAESEAIEAAIAGATAPTDPAPAAELQPVVPSPEETSTPPVDPKPQPAPAANVPSDADHRFAVLQGKYNAEVPRLHEENARLGRQLDAVNAEMQQLRQAAQKPADPPAPLVSPKDVDDFGADMVDMVRRVAIDAATNYFLPHVSKLANGLETRIAMLEKNVTTVSEKQHMTAEDSFYSNLSEQVKDWEAINSDSRWITWLAQYDDLLGSTRQHVLDAAAAALDVKRTVAIFSQFKKEHMVVEQPVASTAPPPKPTPPVSPSRSSASAPATTQEANIWTPAAIDAFYRDVRMGKFKGREAEMQLIEADLDAAYSEGRIRQG
jgi:hypothetical protein